MKYYLFKTILAFLMLPIFNSYAGQKEQIVQDFITGTSTKKAILDEMIGSDVQLINHYLYWKKDGYSASINIEDLQTYFLAFDLKARESLCEKPPRFKSLNSERLFKDLSLNFIEDMKRFFSAPISFYPAFRVENELKRELAIFELCQFGIQSYLSLAFDPAGLGGLNRNFEFLGYSERSKEVCTTVTYQVLKDQYNTNLDLLTLPANLKEARLCR